MYAGRDFHPADPGESEIYTFDFVNDVLSGETLSNATWTCEAIEGTDASASSRLSGAPSNTGTKSSHRVANLQEGVKYRLRCVAVTSAGNTVSLFANVKCTDL